MFEHPKKHAIMINVERKSNLVKKFESLALEFPAEGITKILCNPPIKGLAGFCVGNYLGELNND